MLHHYDEQLFGGFMKSLIAALALTISLSASANTLLNGISYGAHEMCFNGDSLVALVTKTRNLYRENGEGDLIVVGKETVRAGQAFAWRRATSFSDNGQGDSVAVSFDRNGRPMVVSVTKRGSDENEEVIVTKTPVAFCK